jgi:hypothetical protein
MFSARSTEIAQNFKEQGNEYFKEKRYREALGFYTQGVDAQPTDVVLQEALLCNRAACHLELGEFFIYFGRFEVDAVRSHRKLWVCHPGLRKSLGEQFSLLESFVPLRSGPSCPRSAGGRGRALRSMFVI